MPQYGMLFVMLTKFNIPIDLGHTRGALVPLSTTNKDSTHMITVPKHIVSSLSFLPYDEMQCGITESNCMLAIKPDHIDMYINYLNELSTEASLKDVKKHNDLKALIKELTQFRKLTTARSLSSRGNTNSVRLSIQSKMKTELGIANAVELFAMNYPPGLIIRKPVFSLLDDVKDK